MSYKFIKYEALPFSRKESLKRSEELYQLWNKRRTIRHFSDKNVEKAVIENIIKTAGTAPSGANKQPWTFCAVSNAEVKKKIREAAEQEEIKNYGGRMSEEWRKDLEKFKTNAVKPFLEIAPWIIVVFKKSYDLEETEFGGTKNYYVNESIGLATGMLLAAIHNAGLCSLTHTPSPLNFLTKVLNRPKNEKPFLLIPVGYPAQDCEVPQIRRKTIDEIAVFYE